MSIADVIAGRTGHDGTVAASDGPRAGRPRRRTFTAEYKLRILEEYENAESPRERAALLRREGIYSSSISEWRRARDSAARETIPESRPGRPARSVAEAENERLRRENEKLATQGHGKVLN
jgi:transposase